MFIDIKDLSYKGKQVLKDSYISLQNGTFINIIGVNGAGKSSFYKALLGFVKYKGKSDIRPNEIAIISDYVSIPDETLVIDIINFVNANAKQADSLKNLRKMLGINQILNTRIKALSTGEKRKLEIFCALAAECKVIIYDEITANIDEPSRDVLLSFIKDYHKNNRESIAFFSSHDLKEIFKLGGEIWLINPVSQKIENITGLSMEDVSMKMLGLK